MSCSLRTRDTAVMIGNMS